MLTLPAVQGEQTDAPDADEWPELQLEQAATPVVPAYLPASQSSQTVFGLPLMDVLPVPQSAHAVRPVVAVYLPASQLAHVAAPASAAIVPTAQS